MTVAVEIIAQELITDGEYITHDISLNETLNFTLEL
jgi:hypothetical protein